jgi:hypothetical protein
VLAGKQLDTPDNVRILPVMRKAAELFVRMDQEMLDAIDVEAERIGETRSTVARMMLREVLAARGHYATTESERANVRASADARKRAARQPKP